MEDAIKPPRLLSLIFDLALGCHHFTDHAVGLADHRVACAEQCDTQFA